MKKEVKRNLRNLLAKLLICSMLLSTMFAINPSGLVEAASAKPEISKKTRTILIGDSYNLNVLHKVKNSTYKWTTSKKSVASVNNRGIVKGISKGKAIITCTVKANKKTYKLTSTVTIRKPAAKIEINNKVTTLNVGQKYNLNRTLRPVSSNDKTTWTTSDSKIAAPNKYGKFTAKKEGTVTITGTTLSGKKDQVTIKVVDAAGTVSTQEELEKLLGSGVDHITIKTDQEEDFNIPEGDYSGIKLTVKAPNSDVTNNGVFASVNIEQIKANTWYEQAIGNILNVSAPNARIAISENASAAISVNNNGSRLTVINNGTVTGLTLNANAEISIAGSSTTPIPVTANAEGATITSSVPMNLTCNQRINLVILPGAEATTVRVASEEFVPVITGSTSITVIVGTGDAARTISVAPTVDNSNKSDGSSSAPSQPTNPVDPTPVDPIPDVTGTITGKVTAVSGSSIGVVSGSAITASDSAISTSGSSIIANAQIRILKYDRDIAVAIETILTNSNVIVASTNQEGIYTVNNLEAGNYVVAMIKEGYEILIQLTTVSERSTTIINGQLIPVNGSTDNGVVNGDLINALTGDKVDENLSFTIEVYKDFNNFSEKVTTQTVSGSAISLTLPEGYYTIKVIDNRPAQLGVTYATTTKNIVVLGGTTFADQDVILSTLKDAGQATFVLTWGQFPSDLDSHLIGPVENDPNYHIYYANQTYPEHTEEIAQLHLRLDLDDVTSFGPETTSIYKPVAGGIYTFYVYNYSGNSEGTLVNSNAKVVVTTQNNTYTFEVPAGGDQRSWVVCKYNSSTGEIIPINQLVANDYIDTLQ